MSRNLLEFAFWMFVRGQVPGNQGFGAGRDNGPLVLRAASLLRIVAILAGSIALLSLALWATVWLAIRLL